MKKITFLITGLVILTLASHAYGDDVYNFYFQKAPGPVTVNQGGNGPSQPSNATISADGVANGATAVPTAPQSTTATGVTPPPVTAAAVQTTAAVAPATKTEEPELLKWQILLGQATVADDFGRGTGGGLGVKYSFSKYVGADVGITRTRAWDAQDRLNGSAGLVLTPFHLKLFGYEALEFSFLGGILSYDQNDPDVAGRPGFDYRSRKIHWAPYLGVETTLNLTKNLAANARYKMLTDSGNRLGHGIVGLSYRF